MSLSLSQFWVFSFRMDKKQKPEFSKWCFSGGTRTALSWSVQLAAGKSLEASNLQEGDFHRFPLIFSFFRYTSIDDTIPNSSRQTHTNRTIHKDLEHERSYSSLRTEARRTKTDSKPQKSTNVTAGPASQLLHQQQQTPTQSTASRRQRMENDDSRLY